MLPQEKQTLKVHRLGDADGELWKRALIREHNAALAASKRAADAAAAALAQRDAELVRLKALLAAASANGDAHGKLAAAQARIAELEGELRALKSGLSKSDGAAAAARRGRGGRPTWTPAPWPAPGRGG